MTGEAAPAGNGPGGTDERLTPDERLRRRADFLRCYRQGRRRQGALAILYSAPNQLGHPRLGITASKKVGTAVVRQRLKRWVREVYRRGEQRRALPALDLVVHLQPAAAKAEFASFQQELTRLLRALAGRAGGRAC
jgi:ribonuclease P protein component